MKLIDISHHQGKVDFNRVRNAGYEGVIIKAGGSDAGFYKDSRFEENYAGAKNAGLYVGSYYYVGKNCLSAEDGVEDAIRFAEILKGKQFDLPIYMDVEAPASDQKTRVTDAIIGFCTELENRGYYVGVYGSDISGFKEKIDYERIKDMYTLWVARYGSKPKYVTNYSIWQYSETGVVDGINDDEVDLDECYVDFPVIIKDGGYNGYSKEQPKKTIEELANEVINGLWGNGQDRKRKLTEAGYDYQAVQNRVNEILKPKEEYYPACDGSFKSLVDALKSVGVDSSFENRKNIANRNGIHNYSGTATENNRLLAKLKSSRLLK